MPPPVTEREGQDFFDRIMGAMTGRPDVLKTHPVIRRDVSFLGTTETFNVQTFREEGKGDTVFLEYSSAQGFHRYVLPPVVAATIAAQRSTLDTQTRKRAARRAVETRKAKGGKP